MASEGPGRICRAFRAQLAKKVPQVVLLSKTPHTGNPEPAVGDAKTLRIPERGHNSTITVWGLCPNQSEGTYAAFSGTEGLHQFNRCRSGLIFIRTNQLENSLQELWTQTTIFPVPQMATWKPPLYPDHIEATALGPWAPVAPFPHRQLSLSVFPGARSSPAS